jgi:hypothetical protein
MTRSGISLMCAVGTIAACLQAGASTPDPNKYDDIAKRNLFALKAKPITEPAAEPEKPRSRITVAGIATVNKRKQVVLNVQAPAGAPGQQAKNESMLLSEGQREGQLEVVSIDEKQGSVRLNDYGTVMTLTLDKNGPPTPSPTGAPNPAGTPVASNNPAVGAAAPHAPPVYTPLNTAMAKNLQNRYPRVPNTTNPQTGLPTGAATPPVPNVPQQLTAEEQAVLRQVEQAVSQQSGMQQQQQQTTYQYPVQAQPQPQMAAPPIPPGAVAPQ